MNTNNMTLYEVIGTGLFLLEEADDYDIFADMLDVYIRYNYEDNSAVYSSKDMCRILYSAFRSILIETYDITTNDKGIILDAILLFHDSTIEGL